MLEGPLELEAVQTEYAPQKPMEPPLARTAHGSNLPCTICGRFTIAFALILLPLMFLTDGQESLDWIGVGFSVVMLLGLIQTEYAPQKPLEPPHGLPAQGSKLPCTICGSFTIAFSLILLPLMFLTDGQESLDWIGVGFSVVMLLGLIVFGLVLLLCHPKELEDTKMPVVIVRERKMVTILGSILWLLGFILLLMGVIVADTPPFDAGVTAFVAIPGICSGSGSFRPTDSQPFHSSAEQGREKTSLHRNKYAGHPTVCRVA